MAGHEIRVHDFAVGDRTNLIERFAVCVSMHRFDVDSFMKARVNCASRCLGGVAHKTVSATFPRRGFHAFVIALYVLIKCGSVA
jgi:hypothetical protein